MMQLDRRIPMRLRAISLAAGILVSLAIAAAPAAAQVTTAAIEGVVTDSSGAVLAGVNVEISNVDTNLTRSLVTDNDGRFAALQLPPGRYSLTLKLSGFATVKLESVLATVGETVRVSPTMKPGTTETVNVTAESLAVDTARSAAASLLDETTVRSTPILGRKFEDLLTLTPGVSVVQGPDGDEITLDRKS